MGKNSKKKSSCPPHDLMTSAFPQHASTSKSTIFDIHTHLLSTFALYRSKYPEGKYETAFDFVEGVYAGKGVETIVDVWCEPEVFMRGTWKELADGKWEPLRVHAPTTLCSRLDLRRSVLSVKQFGGSTTPHPTNA
ncbi:hypothetical protein EV421DRAFT_1913836 [Armillaria borealis]|uniref:Uncharacterized protein n=1 Tax=Armillaria borealis TaxID=47425 RepID=A0AA39MDJ0_9AGAR|nr:hypothetical protein EV421DRAFT_1913836 [Armillaria borealis]